MSYQGYYQQANLPVDPTRLNNNNYTSHLPNLGNLDLGNLQQVAAPMVESLLQDIQNNAEKSPIRVFAFNFWGDNCFANEMFLELLYAFSAHVETIVATQRANPEQVIMGEASRFVAAATAQLTEQFQDLYNYLPPGSDQQLRPLIIQWHEMVRNIKTFQGNYQSNQQMQSQMQRGWGSQGVPMSPQVPNRPSMNMGGLGSNMNRSSNMSNQGPIRPSWDQGNDFPAAQQGGAGKFNSMGVMNNVNSGPTTMPTPMPATTPTQPQQPKQPDVLKKVDMNAIRNDVHDSAQNKPSVNPPPGLTTKPNRPYDRVILQDRSELIPAFISSRNAQRSHYNPPEVFDRDEKMLFHHISQDGNTREHLQKRKDSMEYLEHELDEKLRSIYKADQSALSKEVIKNETDILKKAVPNKTGKYASNVSESELAELNNSDAPRQLLKPFLVDDLDEAIFKARLEANRISNDNDLLEFQVIEKGQYFFDKGSDLDSVIKLSKCKDYADFIATMGRLAEANQLDDEIGQCLNQRMTVLMNNFLKRQMFTSVGFDSFIEDYFPALELVYKKYGAQIKKMFEDSGNAIINQATSVLTGADLDKASDIIPSNKKDEIKQIVILSNRYSVTQLPWTIYQVGSQWRLEGLLTSSSASVLHEAVMAVRARTETNNMHYHVLLTSDKTPIYILDSPMNKEDVIITLQSPLESHQRPTISV